EGKETETYSYKLPESVRKNAQLIDDKLKNIRVCDPAIGSGAFPVGMMNEIIRTRNTLTNYLEDKKDRSIYNFKRDAIQNSLYGVDIDPGAVEIAKLRLWLSLVVDEEDIKQIKPLPNLDYKIMQGNSLLEEFEGVRLFDEELISKPSLDDDEYIATLKQKQSDLQHEFIKLYSSGGLNGSKKQELDMELRKVSDSLKKLTRPEKPKSESGNLFDIFSEAKKKAQELKQLHKEFFEASQKTKKDELKRLIENLEWELIETSLREQNKTSALKQLEQYKKTNTKPFFLWKLNFAEVFAEKGGFDVIIANPPYVKEYVNRSAFDGLRSSPYYQGKMDLWYLFASKSIDLVKSNSGSVTFIAQNNWVTSYGASKIRNKIIKDTQILSLIDFGDFKIFKTAGIQTMVMMFKKDVLLENYSFDYRRLQGNDLVLDDILALLNKSGNSNAEYLNPTISRTNFIDKTLTFSNSSTELILGKIRSTANFHLDPVKEVAQGIVCPQDYVIKSSLEVLGDHFKIGDGIFVLSDNEVKTIGFSEKELALIKPYYTTSELQRWYGNPENRKWIIYTNSSFRDKKKIEDYPSIKTHLDQFKKVITSDNKPYGLHRARDEHFFLGEKVIALRKCTEPTFTYTDFDAYVSATFYVIKTERMSQKYLTGLLNSNLIAFWLRHKGKMQGNNYQIDKEPIIDLPILEPTQSEQGEITNIVDQIIKATKTDNENLKVHELEKQIDQLVYKLYDLTPEEKAVIEKNG
ncbi:MAG: N-6 DNA methylase, partial [Candidatus Levybacteria bacterium]|nr:N-6 DNA methylase [Candidatus Levybacteria bacterium]